MLYRVPCVISTEKSVEVHANCAEEARKEVDRLFHGTVCVHPTNAPYVIEPILVGDEVFVYLPGFDDEYRFESSFDHEDDIATAKVTAIGQEYYWVDLIDREADKDLKIPRDFVSRSELQLIAQVVSVQRDRARSLMLEWDDILKKEKERILCQCTK